jgi:hypothetical protein
MTSLISWVGVDSRGPASLYLASDSRISWGRGSHWDMGRKLFTCRQSPDLFGYCGDVLFPSLLLSQVSERIDLGFKVSQGTAMRHTAFLSVAEASHECYPAAQRRAFTILHSARDSSGMSSVFHLWRTSWDPLSGWSDEEIGLPTESVLILAVGSGESTVASYDDAWRRSEVGRTSRAVFSAFCDSLRSGTDSFSGGAPQLVGLYRKGVGESFGIIYQNARYLFGVPAGPDEAALMALEWRNELFERCDVLSLKHMSGAQRHARPKHL